MNIYDINFAAESFANRCDPTNEREAAFAEMLRRSIVLSDTWREMEQDEYTKRMERYAQRMREIRRHSCPIRIYHP
jgi:hypothetical protein